MGSMDMWMLTLCECDSSSSTPTICTFFSSIILLALRWGGMDQGLIQISSIG
jgi:hypothetical protein